MFKREEGESWKEAMLRVATQYGLQHECLEEYDKNLESGYEEEGAAIAALYSWGCL